MLDVGEGLVDFGVEGSGEGVGETIPAAWWVRGWIEGEMGRGGTLAGYVYSVGESDGLTVVEILLRALDETFVVEVLGGRHAGGSCFVSATSRVWKR